MASVDHEPFGSPATAGELTTRSSFTHLAPEIQGQLYDRLAGMGLLFAGGWVATYAYHRVAHMLEGVPMGGDAKLWNSVTIFAVMIGLCIWFAARRRAIPARRFFTFAAGFQVFGGASIYFGMSRYLDMGMLLVELTGRALGIEPADLGARLVQPLEAEGVRLLYAEGVNWVAAWLLIYPIVVPMSTGRTLVSTLLTAATVPATLIITSLVRGVPEAIAPWNAPYILEATIPTFICAGMAIYGSRIVYRLTQDLSRAKRMGNYELVECIGRGGMGEVWRAKHRLLARPAAIKLVRPEVLGADETTARTVLKRFEREVQLTTQLTHPHTITIYDYGRTPTGTFYYVMELLEGIDLETFVERFGPAPPARVIAWMRDACGSLHEAHTHGLTHRDIKPANLFTCRMGLRTDFLKVLDFGLVKRSTSPEDADETRMTIEQQTVGTPAYMPPEVTLGAEAEPRSDLYALGCVMMWLLTGQTVFPGKSSMQQAVDHAKTTPIPPSARVEVPIPEDLEAIVMDCLAKDPEARPADAGALARSLASCVDADAWSEDASFAWWERHRPQVSLGGSTQGSLHDRPMNSAGSG